MWQEALGRYIIIEPLMVFSLSEQLPDLVVHGYALISTSSCSAMEAVDATATKDRRGGIVPMTGGKAPSNIGDHGHFPSMVCLPRRGQRISTKLLGSEWTADTMYSAAVMIGALLVAVCAPSLGVIADRRMIVVAENSPSWARSLVSLPSRLPRCVSSWIWALIMFMMASVGLNGAASTNSFCHTWAMNPRWIPFQQGLRCWLSWRRSPLGGPSCHEQDLDGAWVIPFAMASSGIGGWALPKTFRMVPEPHIENEMEPMGLIPSTKMALGEVEATLSDIKSFQPCSSTCSLISVSSTASTP